MPGFLNQLCPGKIVSAETAVSRIKNGSRVFIGSGCGEPQHLIHSMVKDPDIQDIMIFQMLSFTLDQYMNDTDFLERFALKLFFVSIPMQQAASEGKIDYIPSYLSEIPKFFRSNQIGLDVALIQISPPDQFGFASLGISVDVTREAARNTKLVIAQVNPQMPRTYGDGFIHVNDVNFIVPFEEPLVEHPTQAQDPEIARRIGRYVAELIDDGSTLQVGYGQLPYDILRFFNDKNDLGVHTHMITDAFLPLFKNGVITNKHKNYLADRAVATFCMGSRASYDYIDNNPSFYFGTADFVTNPGIVGQNDNFISISSALEVDLTGQVCSDKVGRMFFSGTGDQTNFIRGAALSRGGMSIIALPSTAKNGTVSTIVAALSQGAGLATLRADVNFVVTEYGIAQLQGKSVYQRVVELAQIAHPDFRADLIESAKNNHYIFADQLPPPAEDLIFIENYKSRTRLKNGKVMSVQPLLPSDEIAFRNFFYSLNKETISYRFFSDINTFSRKMAQKHWAHLDYRKNISLAGFVRNKGNKEIIAIGTYSKANSNRAEVAFVVREDYQGQGVASFLLGMLEKIALDNGFKGFCATVLQENNGMLHVFNKRYPNARKQEIGKEVHLTMDFKE
ncbi:MAG: GNAT family N-acetyltransferase [Desulfobacteraceae bacterium]|nr:GNAT family N-acetyltransferase [Desulfobacteraceae bacterium]